MKDGEACLVSRNDPMHDSVPYLRNALKNDTDILQEYFVPRERLLPFVDGLREVVRKHDANLLNASVRVVGQEDNRLSYAPEPAYSVVLYFNQRTDADGNARMARLTSDLIDLTHAQGGRFFLPYQLHYSPEQLERSYPGNPRLLCREAQVGPGRPLQQQLVRTLRARPRLSLNSRRRARPGRPTCGSSALAEAGQGPSSTGRRAATRAGPPRA